MSRRIYKVKKHGEWVERIDNLGPQFLIPDEEKKVRKKYSVALLEESEKNVLWHVAKGVNGDIANLGHSRGGSAAIMGAALKFVNKPHKIHSVDTFHNPSGRQPEGWQQARQRYLDELGIDNVILYRGFTGDFGKQWLANGRQFDFTFIDAGHDYDNVKEDWINFSQMSRLVGFHDTNQIYTDDVINELVLPGNNWKLIHHVTTVKVFERV